MSTSSSSSGSIPKNIGPFKVNGVIGTGGMGVVFDAVAEDGKRVALKIINPKGDSHQRQLLTARLLREAKLLQEIDHEGIVRLYGSGSVSDLVYLAMEFVEGITLDDVRRREVRPDLGLVLGVGRQLTDAIWALHQAGVTHRDIKPSNVLIDRTGRVILIDFGIARSEEGTSITSTGEILGSPGYVAPELLEGARASEHTDQFALGKLLFEISSSPPRDKIPRGTPVLVRFALRLQADWSRFPEDPAWNGLADVIRRMISLEPKDRYPSLAEVRAALADAQRAQFAQLAGASLKALSNPDAERSGSARPASQTGSSVARKAEGLRSKTNLAEESNRAAPDDSRERLRRFLREVSIQPRSPWRLSESGSGSARSMSEASRGTGSASMSVSVAAPIKRKEPISRIIWIGALAFAVFFGLGELYFLLRPARTAAQNEVLGAEILREARDDLSKDDVSGAETALKRCIAETGYEKCQSQLDAIKMFVSGEGVLCADEACTKLQTRPAPSP